MKKLEFSHVKSGDVVPTVDGLRDFFKYQDLGIADATNNAVIAQIVSANSPPAEGTGWHYHGANFHIVYMLKGWAKFMYEDQVTLVEAGDCVHQKPGIVHYLFDYSPDMEFLEIVSPAKFKTTECPGPDGVVVPAPAEWPVN